MWLSFLLCSDAKPKTRAIESTLSHSYQKTYYFTVTFQNKYCQKLYKKLTLVVWKIFKSIFPLYTSSVQIKQSQRKAARHARTHRVPSIQNLARTHTKAEIKEAKENVEAPAPYFPFSIIYTMVSTWAFAILPPVHTRYSSSRVSISRFCISN